MKIIEQTYKWAKPLYKRSATNYIILHHEAGSGMTAQQIHQMHVNLGWAGIGYHYFIRKDGSVYRGRPENTIGTHCPSRNSDSIAVAVEGNFETETMGAAQYNALVELVADIKRRYNVPIKKHKDFYATACPGKNYPYDKLLADVEDELMTGEQIWEKLTEYLCSKPESAWSVDEGGMAWAKYNKIMDGTKPQALVTREQLAAILFRQSRK